MSEKKQSSIDWLTEKISYQTSNGEVITYHKNIADLIQQAKAMHREEIEEAYEAGQNNVDYTASFVDEDGLENYYNKTYSA
jgi:hypothetical protein